MADFLSRLVARSLGTAPLVRPVVAPLFARGPAIAADPSVGADEPAESTAESDGWADAVAPPPARVEPGRIHTAFSRPSSKEPDGRRPDARPTPAVVRPERIGPSVEREWTAAPPLEEQPEEPGGEAPAPRRAGARRLSTEKSSNSATLDPRPTAMPARSSLGRDVSRERRSAALPSAEREPPAPIVQISIGRVEVRAVTAPESGAAKPAPPRVDTRLSLEEYLKTGKRGR